MAALVVSPIASPLQSPRFLPGFQKEQSDTTALVDGLLTAWSEQQSRCVSLDRQQHFEEPTSFPFPDSLNTDFNVPEVSLDADFSGYTSYDFDALFVDCNQTTLCSEYDHKPTLDSISAANIASSNIHIANVMYPEPEITSDDTRLSQSTDSRAQARTQYEATDQTTLHSMNDNMVTTQSRSFEISASLTHYITPGSDTQWSSDSLHADTSLHQGVYSASPTQGFAFSLPLSVSTPFTPSTNLRRRLSTIADQYYSNASSNRKKQKVQELPHNNRFQYRDKLGAVIGTEIILGHEKPIRRPLSVSDKAMTKATRARGACDSCRLNKKRCNRPADPTYDCCPNCLKSKVFSMPCFVAKIVEVQLFRDKPSPQHPRSGLRKIIFESLTDVVRNSERQRPIIVTLTQDLGLQMLVVLARYNPLPGESTHRTWKKDGQTKRIDLPPYCIANMGDAQCNMLEYINNCRSAFLKHVLGRSNVITRGLFDQAQRIAAFNPESTVSKALDLCAASRIIERDWRICGGPPDLGIPLVSDDPSNPFYDFVPITPMMDAQLDQIVIHSFLVPTRDVLLQSLQEKMTSSSGISSFFEIFLTVAVLLSHGEWLLSHSRQNALRVGSKTRYNHIPRAESYFHACNTLIAYWHYMCRGASLAELDWKKESIKKWAGLDSEQAIYLDSLRRRVIQMESKSRMLQLRKENKYEEELYWCHQLFFPNWKAGAKSVEEEVITN